MTKRCWSCERELTPVEVEYYENMCEDCEERACLGLAAEMLQESERAACDTTKGEIDHG